MKLSSKYLNRLIDGSEEFGIINRFFILKHPNQLFLIRISDVQLMEKEIGVESGLINFDAISNEAIVKYFRPISENQILLGMPLHKPTSFDKLLGGQSEAMEKLDIALFDIELKYLDYFKSQKTSYQDEEHDRLYLHRRIYTDHSNISLTFDDEIPALIKNECMAVFKNLFKENKK
jgi:hypothetical protein